MEDCNSFFCFSTRFSVKALPRRAPLKKLDLYTDSRSSKLFHFEEEAESGQHSFVKCDPTLAVRFGIFDQTDCYSVGSAEKPFLIPLISGYADSGIRFP